MSWVEPVNPSAFHAKHLTKLGHHLDQVLLVFHHLLDRFVRSRNLVEHAAVLAALHSTRLRLEILHREAPPRLAATHPPPGAVARALEALLRTEAAHDEAPRSHAPRDDAQLALAGADGSLARDQDILAEVGLLGDVVVMAEHPVREPYVRPEPAQHVLVQPEHRLPVLHRVALRPEEVAPVLLHLLAAGEEDGEIAVRQVLVVGELPRPLDVDLSQGLADVAA